MKATPGEVTIVVRVKCEEKNAESIEGSIRTFLATLPGVESVEWDSEGGDIDLDQAPSLF